uniref:Uncharacterized protein n=1 Tax=Myotis myotis TaxID=51298 RepID=A0A7J7VYM7_MYOMY|nr:hypothetical protein mMyoMyo1_012317 [Myotis myotis]
MIRNTIWEDGVTRRDFNTGPICLLFLSEPGREGADRDGVQLAQGADPPGLYWHRSYIKVQTSPLILAGSLSEYMPLEQAGCSPCPCSHRSEPWIGKQRMLFGLKRRKQLASWNKWALKQLEN